MPHETVSFDEPKLQDYLGELVRKTVQDSLNALLDAQANQIVNAGRYERQACCFGHYRQNLNTTSRDVALKHLEALRGAAFASKVIEHYHRQESFLEQALMEM